MSHVDRHLPHFFWWVLQHCTGFARLVWGRLRVHRAFIYSNWFVCSVCFCSLLPRLTLLLSCLDILHCLPRAVGVPLESALNLVSPMSPCGAHDTHACCARSNDHLLWWIGICHTRMPIHSHVACHMTLCLSTRFMSHVDIGWLRLVGSLKLQVSFAKEPYKRDDILQKRPIILRSLLIVATP